MSSSRLPIPGLYSVSTLLEPIVMIRPLRSYRYSVELDTFYAPTDVLPRYLWAHKLERIERKISTRAAKGKFPSFEEAYDFVFSKLQAYPSFDEKKIAADPALDYDQNTDTLISRDTRRFFINYRFTDRSDFLQLEWDNFLKVDGEYKTSPNTFYNAYEWVNAHPMFWVLKGDPRKDSLLHWQTGETFYNLWHTVFRQPSTGKVTHQFEGGPSMCQSISFGRNSTFCLPQSITSLDPALTVSADTYESAVIEFAKKIEAEYPLHNMDSWLYTTCEHQQ